MKVIVRWHDGEIDYYDDISAISSEGPEVILVSEVGDDVALFASQIKTIEIGGIN